LEEKHDELEPGEQFDLATSGKGVDN